MCAFASIAGTEVLWGTGKGVSDALQRVSQPKIHSGELFATLQLLHGPACPPWSTHQSSGRVLRHPPPSPFKKILARGGRINDFAGWLEKVGEFCAGKLPREGKPGSVEEGQFVVCVRGEPRLGPCPVLPSWLLGV